MLVTTTERLIIRQFTEDDIEALFMMNSRTEMLTYIPTVPFTELSQAESLLKHVVFADYKKHGFGRWAVAHKVSGEVIGFCGPKYLPDLDKIEIGYRYFPECWGQGLGTEAARAVIDICYPNFKINEIIALILAGNIGSEQVAKRIGMHWQQEQEFMGYQVNQYYKRLQPST
ncbi:GNAT family N-acetyltransferase [Shewanella sp. NIFS-20-20]|uniref:GNAT family N-acetyltransferase n=1 Tax=Shewanella sp. NIFS-20-20 TaxID=2853806 RepID=UPI001C469ECC|nr:GNAT family N-acetyltransferase [Shewanella sp. NIFS-20-20]MBV7315776.1 GNAT family N-acetyltransferase [Shewanella sp. NIFS-20-20]